MAAHFHAAPGGHNYPGDNGVCRCAAHAAPSLPSCEGCSYECYLCERTRILETRVAERDNPLPLPGEEKRLKEAKRAASIARGGCGCRSYTSRALAALKKGA